MSASINKCGICGEGNLTNRIDKNTVEYKGNSAELDMHYSVCDACGSEQSDAAQLRLNKRAMVAFKKRVDGLLTGKEVRELRRYLGLKQNEAAKVFGGGPVAFSKYEADDVAQSEAMDKLLRLAGAEPSAVVYLKQQAGLATEEEHKWTVEIGLPESYRPALQVVGSSTPDFVQDQGWKQTA